MAHRSGLEGLLDAFAQNYSKEDKHKIEDAVIKEGLQRTGKRYSDGSVNAKINAGCRIFSSGQQQEALELCNSSRCK